MELVSDTWNPILDVVGEITNIRQHTKKLQPAMKALYSYENCTPPHHRHNSIVQGNLPSFFQLRVTLFSIGDYSYGV